jgi:hypothetical protein
MFSRRQGNLCMFCARTGAARTFERSLLLTMLMTTRGDIAFVRVTKFIGGWDPMEQFLACGMYPLAVGVGFDRVAAGVTPVSKLKLPPPKFVAVCKDDVQFLVRTELDAEGIVGSYTCPEHDSSTASLRNEGRLNREFELAGVA